MISPEVIYIVFIVAVVALAVAWMYCGQLINERGGKQWTS